MTMLKTEKHVAKREDTLDSLFEWAERTFCPAGMRNYKPEPKADTLDYVFEHVESFTCRQHKEEPEVANIDLSVHRDVSLIEPGSDGRPHQQKTGRTVKPLGQRGDVIDYVFENVESYACNEDMTDDKKTIRAIQMRTPGLEREPEDEIQLYFRPSRGRRKRQKAEF